KTARGYALPGAAGRPDSSPTGAPLDRALREFVLCVQAAGSLVVVKTPSAAAATLARVLDEAALPEGVGSVAGDDPIFLATARPAAARRVERRLRGPLGPLRRRARA